MVAAAGMAIAVIVTLFSPEIDSYWLIPAGIAVGTVVGAVSARRVRMTAIPPDAWPPLRRGLRRVLPR